ncbi:hypothetical protein BGZ61DRAFT_469789 [Ilyonectria robusta]|uniref:uncharacterized protein n=1 Tax=Ilyonectria robusta TaxID=1079257 RepID=UPI001E8E5EAD|nr:uncharacterized protein BGZ61DRAFT_469789 [Ilyonectria robusta]KAH8648127.1 hypothetical protein BGZ61DRAFT_469789 [Ilyonectria robusta]
MFHIYSAEWHCTCKTDKPKGALQLVCHALSFWCVPCPKIHRQTVSCRRRYCPCLYGDLEVRRPLPVQQARFVRAHLIGASENPPQYPALPSDR